MTRFIVCIDIDEDDLTEAYAKLWEAMNTAERQHRFWEGFESTDEAFGPDGEQIDVDVLHAARNAYFERKKTT